MIKGLVVGGMSLALMVGCTAAGPDAGDGAGSATGQAGSRSAAESPAPSGNGTLLTTRGADGGDELTISAWPINADGSIGPATDILTAPVEGTAFPVVIDGVGSVLLTGTTDDYWTTDVQVYEAGEQVNEIPAQDWCGGEGLSYNQCVLLDVERMARTTDLGRDPVSGAGPEEGSIIISSLTDGSTLAEYGPFPDLTHVLGTDSPDRLLLISTEFTSDQQPGASSTVQRLDLTDGTTTDIASSPAGWLPTCPIGNDAVLGGTVLDGYEVVVVGDADAAEIRIDDAEPAGCSADGRFLFAQRYAVRQAQEGTSASGAVPATVQRIEVASGEQTQVAELAPGAFVALVTR